MDMHKYSYLLMIAKESSLTKAAEKLFITPSALSQHITKEEQNLGVQLFIRTREKWIPTHAGQIYLAAARQIMEINNTMERQLLDIADGKTGSFSVGVTPGYGTAMFAEAYPLFREKYPGVKIHLIEANWKRLQRLILDNTLELAFTYLCDPERELSPSLEGERLADEPFILFVPKSHPIARLYDNRESKDPLHIDLSLFGNDSFIGMSKETTLFNAINELFKKTGISPDIIFESTSTITVHNLVLKGLGIAILPRFYARESENAVFFKITPNINWSVLAVNRRGYQKSNAMNYFIDLAKQFYDKYSDYNFN